MKYKSYFSNIILFWVSIVVSLVTVEILLHLVKPSIPYQYLPQHIEESYYENSPHTEFGLKKNYSGRFVMSEASFDSVVKTNSRGWRDDEPDSRSKVLVFGDSFAFGFGLSNGETIPDYLEALAEKKFCHGMPA